MLSKCHIDASGKYRSVYPKHSFEDMISMFRNIGEIFLVRSDDNLAACKEPTDHYVFFDIQFLIDFMKDIVTVDDKKKRDRLKAEQWEQLDKTGKAGKELLQLHLKRFYESKANLMPDDNCPLERQPLVRSLLQLDFISFVEINFMFHRCCRNTRYKAAIDITLKRWCSFFGSGSMTLRILSSTMNISSFGY